MQCHEGHRGLVESSETAPFHQQLIFTEGCKQCDKYRKMYFQNITLEKQVICLQLTAICCQMALFKTMRPLSPAKKTQSSLIKQFKVHKHFSMAASVPP